MLATGVGAPGHCGQCRRQPLDAGQAVLMSGLGLAQQLQINHTRQAETEADRIGLKSTRTRRL